MVAALRTALISKEYVQTRNALLFLSYNSKVIYLCRRLLILNTIYGFVYVCVLVLLQINPLFGL